MGSLCMASASLGLTLSSAVAILLRSNLSADQVFFTFWGLIFLKKSCLMGKKQMLSFGWRIPFWCGVLVGAFAWWMRSFESHLSIFFQTRSISAPDPLDFELCDLFDLQCRTGIDESYEFRRASNRNTPRSRSAATPRSLSAGLPEIFPDTADIENGMGVNDVPQPVSPLAGSKAAGGDGSEMIVPISSPLPGVPAVMLGWPLIRGIRTHFFEITLIILVQTLPCSEKTRPMTVIETKTVLYV